MKKIISAGFIATLLVLTVICSCFTASASLSSNQQTQTQTVLIVGKGTIKGTITNQNGKPISLVRVIAAGSPKDNATTLGFALTNIGNDGKGEYSMSVPAGRYLFVRAGKLPLYLGAWAGPIIVIEGESVTLDLSITYIGPESKPIVVPSFQTFGPERLLQLIYSIIMSQ